MIYFIMEFIHKKSAHAIELKKPDDEKVEIVFFDNGIGCYWFVNDEHDKNLIFCFRGFQSFLNEQLNIRRIEKFFPHYQIIYIEYPGIGISKDCIIVDYTMMIEEIYNLFQCVKRQQKWDNIGFVGFHYGSVIQSQLYLLIEKNNDRMKPTWIIQINGFSSYESIILFKIPWYIQLFTKNRKIYCSENYKNINIPLLIFHSKNNDSVPLMESIKLHLSLRLQSKFILLYGDKNMTLLSKENYKILSENLKNLFK